MKGSERVRRLLQEGLAEDIADTDLWPGVASRLAPAPAAIVAERRHARAPGYRRSVVLGLAASLSIVGLVLVALWLRPGAASAAVILAHAQAANIQPSAAGLQSYQSAGTFTTHGISVDIESWYLAPNRTRSEICPPEPAADVSQPGDTACTLLVSDGTIQWSFTSAGDRSTILREPAAGSHSVVLPGGQLSLEAFLSEARTTMDAEVIGNDTVAGRPAYVVGLRPKSSGTGSNAITSRLWIDHEYYVVLGWETAGIQMRINTFTVNPSIDTAQFSFTPPAGVPIRCLGDMADMSPCVEAPAIVGPDLMPYPEATPLSDDDPMASAFERGGALAGSMTMRGYRVPATTTLEDIRSFYAPALADAGWTPLGIASEVPDVSHATWIKDDVMLQFVLAPDSTNSESQILVVSVSEMDLDR